MTKSIDTLVPDILALFKGQGVQASPESITAFAASLSGAVTGKMAEPSSAVALRLSNLGTRCERQLWYRINHPEWAEPLQPTAYVKFMFGNILEEMLLYLAEEAGHAVEHRQAEVDLFGVKGHIDGYIDNVLVDVKSASTRSFDKFADHLTSDKDDFGYLTQLDGYLHGNLPAAESLLKADFGAFLVIDKQLGRLCLDRHPKSDIDYSKVVAHKRQMVSASVTPKRGFNAVPDGKSGNMKLDTVCSYCQFKAKCWPGLRTFFYANGPRFLTVVRNLPKVGEGEAGASSQTDGGGSVNEPQAVDASFPESFVEPF